MLASWLEGFAKLHSFKLAGRSLLYSGAMLASPNYVDSVEQGELVPQVRNEDLRDHLEKRKTQKTVTAQSLLFLYVSHSKKMDKFR